MKKLIPCLYLFVFSLAAGCTGAGLGFNENDADLIRAINDDNVSHNQLAEAFRTITALNSRENAFLVRAAQKGNLQAVRFLLQQGADPNLFDNHGRTALMQAAYSNQPEVVRELLSCEQTKLNIEERGMGGSRTALMTAAAFEHPEVVEVFVESPRVDVNYQDTNSGMTALMWAAASRTPQQGIITALRNAGSNLTTQDNEGRTAYAIARQKGHETILDLLHFEGCEPTQTIELPSEPDNDGTSLTLVGAFNFNKTEEDIEIENEDILTNINISPDTNAIPNMTGAFNFIKTKGKIKISGGTKRTNINMGGDPGVLLTMARNQEDDDE